ncbi:hypothetical protein YB2330_004678 [Saitoella coloradoensis]
MNAIPDELLLDILAHLEARHLQLLGACSKALYAFTRFDELWKTLTVEEKPAHVKQQWRGTWRRTYLQLPEEKTARFSVPHLYSDVLYRPYFCSQVDVCQFMKHNANTIARLPNMTLDEFHQQWTNTPFILTEPVSQWPAYEKQWDLKMLAEEYPEVEFRAECVDWPMKTYLQYTENNVDESPVYLFDRDFERKTKLKEEYILPVVFTEDYFAVLGNERPDHRWLIAGPQSSGSTFHKDPNSTSAWNAVLTGKKYWIMFPPDQLPPGVYVSEDQAEVTSPVSLAEWLTGFHREARREAGCLEGICEAGEIIHVPSQWWHLVINLTPSVALTGNFIAKNNLRKALRFMRDMPDQVSGFRKVEDPYALFVKRMEQEHPIELKNALEEMDREDEAKRKKVEAKASSGWTALTENTGGFSFGFGGDDEALEDEE